MHDLVGFLIGKNVLIGFFYCNVLLGGDSKKRFWEEFVNM